MINGSIWNFVFQKPHIVEFLCAKNAKYFFASKTTIFDSGF